MRRRQRLESNCIAGVAKAVSLFCTGMLALALALVPTAALAEGDASLTLKMQYVSAGKTNMIGGVSATAYQVASLDDGVNHFVLTDSFASLGVDFDKGMDASTMAATAKKAAQIVTDGKLTGKAATSGKDGLVKFGALPQGVYLVVQTGSTGDAASYNDFAPFLISVPQITSTGIAYDVVSIPKFTAKPQVKEPSKPLSKTGDSNNPLLWTTYALVGSALVLTGSAIRRRYLSGARH